MVAWGAVYPQTLDNPCELFRYTQCFIGSGGLPMQTLNVGAGQTDNEYKAAEEQRRADLRDESRNDANYFFLAAGLAALGTGLLPIRINVLVSIGVIGLLTLYGRPLGQLYPLVMFGIAAMWVVVVLGLGFAARQPRPRCVWAGISRGGFV